MSFETIQTCVDDASLVITLDRPAARNAFSARMMDEIEAVCCAAGSDERVRSVIVTGGADFFSAGADLKELQAMTSEAELEGRMRKWESLNAKIEELGKPVIAAIEGFCITGGWEFAMACDIRVAGATATFSLTSARIGTIPAAGGTQRLPRQIGVAQALELLFSAKSIDAATACRMGAVNQVVPAGEALAEAKSLARTYAERPALSLAYAKRAVRRGIAMGLAEGIELERQLALEIYATRNRTEGIAALLERRKPNFAD